MVDFQDPAETKAGVTFYDRPLGALCPFRSVPFLMPLVGYPRESFLAACSFLDTVNSNPVIWTEMGA